MCRTFVKKMRRFCFNCCFKSWFSTPVKIWKIRDLMRIVFAIAELGIYGTKCNWNSWKGYSLIESSAITLMYTPVAQKHNILNFFHTKPLSDQFRVQLSNLRFLSDPRAIQTKPNIFSSFKQETRSVLWRKFDSERIFFKLL